MSVSAELFFPICVFIESPPQPPAVVGMALLKAAWRKARQGELEKCAWFGPRFVEPSGPGEVWI